MEQIKIEIINWKKYNPYATAKNKNTYWFALGNKFLGDLTFANFNSEEKLTFIYMLCYASQVNRNPFNLNVKTFLSLANISKKSLISCIEKLLEEQVVKVKRRQADDGETSVRLPTIQYNTKNNTKQNNTLLSSEMTEPLFELWNNSVNNLPKAKVLNGKRKKKIKAALQDVPLLEDWKTIISFLDSDPFYSGQNDRNWKADFDFILQAGKGINILEKTTATNKNSMIDWLKEEDEKILEEEKQNATRPV